MTRYIITMPHSNLGKIIIRARQNFIWKEYLRSNPQINNVQPKVIEGWKIYAGKIVPATALEKYNLNEDFESFIENNATLVAKSDEKFSMHVKALRIARTAINTKDPATYFENVKDVYLPVLDKEVPIPQHNNWIPLLAKCLIL
jgi:hypothetical protein